MEQAFIYFNAGKYKQAFNYLNSNQMNIQSYQPNYAICQYLLSRTTNSLQGCLKKLIVLLKKKNKKENDHYQRLTEQLIKYNIGILMHLNGKKENAYLLFKDIYENEKCFIDFLKYRLLLLLMELNLNMKNGVEALKLSTKYLSNSFEQKNPSSSWISLLFHEHFKSYYISKEQLDFMFGIFFSQSLMQLGINQVYLPPDGQREQLRNSVLQKAKKRKNNTNKYYQLSLLMIDRFFQAQKQFSLNNKQKALTLMNFAKIQSDYQQMPQTKIITNIYSALTNNNTAIVYYTMGKFEIALYFINKSYTLLSKGCTGAEDKDLQLFSSNFVNHSHKICYNFTLVTLATRPSQAFQYFQYFRKIGYMCSDFKYWYRMGQAYIEYYHENYSRLTQQNRTSTLQGAISSFTNSLSALARRPMPTQGICKKIPILKQQEIDEVSLKMKGQTQQYRSNILMVLCYVSLLLKKYFKVILHGKQLLRSEKTPEQTKLCILQYLAEAYFKTNRIKQANKTWQEADKIAKNNKDVVLRTAYYKKTEIIKEQIDLEYISIHQNTVSKIKQHALKEAQNTLQGQRSRKMGKKYKPKKILQEYLRSKLKAK